MRSLIALLVAAGTGVVLAHGCGGVAVSRPEGSNSSGGSGGGGTATSSASGGGEPHDAGSTLGEPCDGDGDLPTSAGVRTCCNGFKCTGNCLSEGDSSICDCGGIEGGCEHPLPCCPLAGTSLFACTDACVIGK